MVSEPYSSSYDSDAVFHGSLPGFRMGMNPYPSEWASAVPKMKPLDSIPQTMS